VVLATAAVIWIVFYLHRHEADMQAAAKKALPGPVASLAPLRTGSLSYRYLWSGDGGRDL
jgi:hypothetical protein